MSEETYSLWLVGGTALLVADTALQDQQYALDSVLFAQLRSDKLNGSRFANYARWYSGYRTALEQRGWTFTRSRSDYQRLQEGAPPTPADLLKRHLQARHPSLSGYLQAAITRLSQEEVQQQLRAFTLAEHEQGSGVVCELGVLLPGPSMDLCGLALGSDPSDGIDLRESVATLGEYVTQSIRQDLHALLERKQQAGNIRNLGTLKGEDGNGAT
jgi:hypothetical protein